MNMYIQFLKAPILSFAIFILSFQNSYAATAYEDSCLAMMLVMPDHNDPLLIHFYFAGNVPVNSFQFLGSWDFGDGFTSTDSCPDHQYSQPGTYVVCLSFSICIGGGMSCHDDTCVTMTIGNTTAIENSIELMSSFYSYPNPAKNEFKIRSDSNKELVLRIRDVSGRLFYGKVVFNDEAIETSSFSNGLYFMEITDGEKTLTRKLVIQK